MEPRVFQWQEAVPGPSPLTQVLVAFHVVVLKDCVMCWAGMGGGGGEAASSSSAPRLGSVAVALPTPYDAQPAASLLVSDFASDGTVVTDAQDQEATLARGDVSHAQPVVSGSSEVAGRLAKRVGVQVFVMGPLWLEDEALARDLERLLLRGLKTRVMPERFGT